MAYIGKTPTVGNFVKLDALTASATASYTMQVDSVNFSPESVNHMLVSLNGVIQAPTTSYTISGATITFASALTSSDSIDFIMVYGNVLDIGTPSDATVTNAKTNFVSTSSSAGLQIKGDNTTAGTLQLNCEQNSHGIKLKGPPHSASASYTLTFPNDDGTSGQALTTDGSGVLTWADAGGTNTPAFHVYLSGDQTVGTGSSTKVAFDSEYYDTDNAFASNKFTVPSGKGGTYNFGAIIKTQSVNNNTALQIYLYKNNSELDGQQSRHKDYMSTGSAEELHVSFSYTDVASVGDYYELYVFQNNGNNRTLKAETSSFWGYKLII